MHDVHFNRNMAFNECDNRPLDEKFIDVKPPRPKYSRMLPFHACGYNEQFFLQFTLNEYSFSEFAPEHAHKATLLYVARERERTRFVQAFEKSLPVLVCSIAVNRDEFAPLGMNEDKVEWLTKLTARTKGIAHELLYAEQYLEKYDWPASTEVDPVYESPIVQPSVDQENRLLCCDKQIEAFLQVVEQGGAKIGNEAQLLDPKMAPIAYAYYMLWLTERVVERDVCHQRTLEFLKAHDRPNLRKVVEAALKSSPTEMIDWDGFVKAKRSKSVQYASFISQVIRANGHIDEEVICLHAEKCLPRSVRAQSGI
jgi:hypothetical protein